jgi:hypothetical protein
MSRIIGYDNEGNPIYGASMTTRAMSFLPPSQKKKPENHLMMLLKIFLGCVGA